MDKVIKNKRGPDLVTSHSSSTKQFQKHSFISYILSDQVWWWNMKWFLSYSKNYIYKFMRTNSWHHKLSHFHFSFWFWKLQKQSEKITKIWIFRQQKELFRWNKKHLFIIFEGLSFGGKKRNLKKKQGTQALRMNMCIDV